MSKPRFTLTAQIYLAVSALLAALLITAGAAWLDAGAQARERFDRQVNDGLDIFKNNFDVTTRDLVSLGNWMAGQKTVADLLQVRDRAGLTRYLEPWSEVSLADVIVVADKAGNALAQVRSGRSVGAGDYAPDAADIAQALTGKRTSSIAPDAAGHLLRRVTVPIYANEASAPIGVVALSFYLDGIFWRDRARQSDQEIAIASGEKIFILTLTDPAGKPWQSGTAPAAVLQAQREARPTDFVEFETARGAMAFRFKPLESPGAAGGALYGVGVSLAAIDRERLNVFRTFWLGLGIIALGAGAAAFLFVRGLTAPIHALDRAAQKIASGDLSREIIFVRNDELGDLARQMETMRQQLRDALMSAATERNRYAAVIQSMGVAALITDHQLNVTAANLAAQSLLEQDAARLVGQSLNRILANGNDGTPDSIAWHLDHASAQGLVARGRFHLRANERAMLDVISTPVEIEGEPGGYVHVLRDAAAEEQLARVKDEFLMNAAHELRGPLASLRASIELLVEDFAEMERADLGLMLRTMQRSVIKFQGLVENLVDIGNIQAGRFRVRPAPVRLDSLIDDALAQVQPMLQARQQSVAVALECGECVVSADRARIAQVLINLITNASKYGPENEPIDVRGVVRERAIVIEVHDHGQGIPPEEQENLFKRFYRGRRAEEEGIGIGLGLALAREIVTAHGGQIGVKSELGKGTTFWFSLPMVR